MQKIITLNDGLQVEVEINDEQYEEISDSFNDKVDSSIENIQSMLIKIIAPINDTFTKLGNDVLVESAKINIGVSIGVEGNFILAKSSANANIQVEMTFRKKNA